VHDPVDASDTPVTAVLCVYTEQRWAMIEAPPAQLLMVVDYNDTLRERATRAFTGVDVVANVHTKGLSGAKNTALDHATQPIITVLDDDAVADPKWIATLLAHFDDPSVVAVGSAVDANWEDRRPVWFAAEFDWTLGCSYVGLPEDVTDVRNVFGGAMAMRRDALRTARWVARRPSSASACSATTPVRASCSTLPRGSSTSYPITALAGPTSFVGATAKACRKSRWPTTSAATPGWPANGATSPTPFRGVSPAISGAAGSRRSRPSWSVAPPPQSASPRARSACAARGGTARPTRSP
jgi:hypothetical protein